MTTSSAKQYKKAVAEGWSLASITGIPLPDSDLFVPPPEPNCELEAPELKADDPRKRDYEKQRYRAAEVFVRSRLLLLQSGRIRGQQKFFWDYLEANCCALRCARSMIDA